ncbi:hypothetical protein ACFE04_010122 [Oxalis oulophora]
MAVVKPENMQIKLNKKQPSFSGRRRLLGCKAIESKQVCLPIRTTTTSSSAADHMELLETKKKLKNVKKQRSKSSIDDGGDDVDDAWWGPSLGFTENSIGSIVVDRAKLDHGDDNNNKISKRGIREPRSKIPARRSVNPERVSFWDSDSLPVGPEPDIFGGRYDRHAPRQHPSPDSFAEILMFRSALRMVGHDRFQDWRLDVDGMTYEQLLELGDRIGYVSTGLKEDEINRCLRKIKHLNLNDSPTKLQVHVDKKCTVCQFEYEEGEEIGKLDCGHSFHISCIRQWLGQKNSCPVCKTTALARR